MKQYELYNYQTNQLLFTPLHIIGSKKHYNRYTILNDYICINYNNNESIIYKIMKIDNINHILYLGNK